jgi:hypothetical protein
MTYFGKRHPAPIYRDIERSETPIGRRCGHCNEMIAAGDDGFTLPSYPACEMSFHRACHLRGIIGSIAHQQKLCSCYVPGSQAEDNPTLSRRAAAEEALAYFER